MCKFYTYKFEKCEHIYTFYLARCTQSGTDWTCNNNTVTQLERRITGYICYDCRSPTTESAKTVWKDVTQKILAITGMGGGTVNLKTGKDAREEIGEKGIMCGGLIPSLMITDHFFNDKTTSTEQKAALLDQYIRRYVSFWWCEFSQPMRYLGYWMDDNKLFIDLSQRFLDPFKAVCMGLYRQEYAVFDLNGMHELQTQPLRDWLQKHVAETVVAAAKRDRKENAIAQSNLAQLRLKAQEKSQLLDPKEIYCEDLDLLDLRPPPRKSPRGHNSSSPRKTLGVLPLKATRSLLKIPRTPRERKLSNSKNSRSGSGLKAAQEEPLSYIDGYSQTGPGLGVVFEQGELQCGLTST